MKTEDLIEHLAQSAPPSGRGVAATLALGLGMGGAVSFALMLLWLGLRPDTALAMATTMYWMKFGYTLVLALCAFWIAERLARPGAPADAALMLPVVPLTVMGLMGAMRWSTTEPAIRLHLLMGASWDVCPWRIVVLALPVFVGVLWSLRRLAPTRPVLAGAAAGLLAGAAGAWVYAFHCDESAAPFVAVWYTLGIAAAGALGGAAGRFFLRW